MLLVFPLIRLPCLALDNVIQVMDPIDQISMCGISQKLETRVKRLNGNRTLYINYNKVRKTVTFGTDACKLSTIKTVYAVIPPENKNLGIVYLNPNEESILYKQDTKSSLNSLCNWLIQVYNPRSVVCIHHGSWTPELESLWDFHLTVVRNRENVSTKTNCQSFSQTIWKNLSSSPLKMKSITNRKADWMSLDDILLAFKTVELVDIKVTNQDLNEFLLKWMFSERARLVEMVLKAHMDSANKLNIHTIVDGLGAVRAPVETGYTTIVVYQIERQNGQKARLRIEGNTIYFNVSNDFL